MCCQSNSWHLCMMSYSDLFMFSFRCFSFLRWIVLLYNDFQFAVDECLPYHWREGNIFFLNSLKPNAGSHLFKFILVPNVPYQSKIEKIIVCSFQKEENFYFFMFISFTNFRSSFNIHNRLSGISYLPSPDQLVLLLWVIVVVSCALYVGFTLECMYSESWSTVRKQQL